MKLAVFSDIHSNYEAFAACVKQAEKEGAEQLVFLGDYVSDSIHPVEVLDLLYRLQTECSCTLIKGNREEYMEARQGGQSSWATNWTYGSQSGSHLFTYEKLREKDLARFAALPITDTLRIPGKAPVCLCHGTPGNTRDALLPDSPEADCWAQRVEAPYILCGHSHRYAAFVCRGKQIINFASVGSPVENDPRASFGILESDGTGWAFRRVLTPYEIEKELAGFIPSGFTQKARWWAAAIAAQLRTGTSYPLRLFERVLELGRAAGTPERLPEALWDQAAEDLGIKPLQEEDV